VDVPTAAKMKERRIYLVPTLYRFDWTVEQAKASASPRLDELTRARALLRSVRRAIQME
jgi:hypothetical protein